MVCSMTSAAVAVFRMSYWGIATQSVGAVTATVAAIASVAVWRRDSAVHWEVQLANTGRSMVVNTGKRTARHVRIRAGSISAPTDQDPEVRVERLRRNERIPLLVSPTMN